MKKIAGQTRTSRASKRAKYKERGARYLAGGTEARGRGCELVVSKLCKLEQSVGEEERKKAKKKQTEKRK
jgi:hypothetical protein